MILSPLVDGISNFLGETCLHGFKYLGPHNGVLTRVVWVSQNFVQIVSMYCTLSCVVNTEAHPNKRVGIIFSFMP